MSIVNFHNNIVSVEFTKAQALNVQSSAILADEFIQNSIKNKTLSKYMISFKPLRGEPQIMKFTDYIAEIKKATVKAAYTSEEDVKTTPKKAIKKVEEEVVVEKPKRGRPAKKVEVEKIEEVEKPKPKRGRPAKKVEVEEIEKPKPKCGRPAKKVAAEEEEEDVDIEL